MSFALSLARPLPLPRHGVFTASSSPSSSSSSPCASLPVRRGYATAPAPFEAKSLVKTLTTTPKEKLPNEKLTFGGSFTDHWLSIKWNEKTGWAAPEIAPYGNISLDPSALCLQYALECFEGMKAYLDKDNNIRLFRPEKNMARMNSSMKRLAMPNFPAEEFLETIKELVKVDKSFIPREEGYSLYLRPTAIATTPILGVNPPSDILLYVIASPVGPYYPTGFKPVSLYADDKNVRAFPGGAGGYKLGSNYGPTILHARNASKKGYQQVLWLLDDKITEVGTMNLFCLWVNKDGVKELITAPLDGTILPGVTRQSILELAKGWGGVKVSEKDWTMPELLAALDQNRVIEMFGSGTAATVSPINGFEYKGEYYDVPCKDDVAGELTHRLLDEISSIQVGRTESPWSVVVEE